MRAYVHILPKRIVVWMGHHVVPKFYRIAEIMLFEIGQRTHAQVKLIIIFCFIFYGIFKLGRGDWLWARHTETGDKSKGVHLEQGPVMVKIITDKPFGYRGLRRYCF